MSFLEERLEVWLEKFVRYLSVDVKWVVGFMYLEFRGKVCDGDINLEVFYIYVDEIINRASVVRDKF